MRHYARDSTQNYLSQDYCETAAFSHAEIGVVRKLRIGSGWVAIRNNATRGQRTAKCDATRLACHALAAAGVNKLNVLGTLWKVLG